MNTRSERALIGVNVILLILVVGLVLGPKGSVGRPLWGTVGRWQANREAATHWGELTDGVGRLDADTGRVTLLVFSDFECPACRSAWPAFHSFLQAHPEIGVGYIHMPIPGHSHARPAARAAICAESQGKMREMTALFFEMPDLVEKEDWHGAAERAAVPDTASYSACLRSARPDSVLARDLALAGRLAIEGTPTFRTQAGIVTGAQTVAGFEQLVLARKQEGK